MFNNTRQIGFAEEQRALLYLQKQGLKLITRNYQCKMGEIDIIMQDKDMLVFVEVRYRCKGRYGDGLDSVTYSKQRKLIRTANYYLVSKRLYNQVACRFDVVAIGLDKGKVTIDWVKNALDHC